MPNGISKGVSIQHKVEILDQCTKDFTRLLWSKKGNVVAEVREQVVRQVWSECPLTAQIFDPTERDIRRPDRPRGSGNAVSQLLEVHGRVRIREDGCLLRMLQLRADAVLQ